MEQKINIAELLKDCPSGMELDCTLLEGLEFDCIIDNEHLPIRCRLKHPNGGYNVYNFTKYGCWLDTTFAKCVIFPKGKTTWEGFHTPFKDGDVVTYKYENGLVSMILNKFVNFVEVHYHCALYDNAKGFVTNNYIVGEPKYTYLATEEEKAKLFKAIEDNGYKWNAETKTLEKLVKPRFKVGDVIIAENPFYDYKIIKITDTHYTLETIPNAIIHNVEIYEDKSWKLIPNKFDISTLKPFESKVLVRTGNKKWVAAFYSHYDKDASLNSYLSYCVVGGLWYEQCIPYEGNEHLLNTTDDCNEFYKNW